MSEKRKDRSVKILIGIGLVLIGLGAGILTMLIFETEAVPVSSERRVVERVQLGDHEESRRMPAPDSGLILTDPQALNQIFKQVAERVTEAVVYIQVEVPISDDGTRQWYHNFDEDTRRRFFRDEPLRQSVGSGVLVSSEGYIVTNFHVVENAQNIQVTLADKRLFDASIVGTDPSTDLAVLRIEDGGNLPSVRFGNSDLVQVGEWVLAVGNPFRLTSTVTAGIVSALGRQVNIIEDSFSIEDFIQTDAAINPGNSGGALVNLDAELVGIATAIATETGSYEGYGFAVPVNLMERVVRDLIEHGEVQRGFLGVEIQDIDARVARRLSMDRITGVYVNSVTPGGAAEDAGVRDGDVITAIDGKSVNASNELQSAVARRRPGETLDVELWRRGSVQSLDITLLGRDAPAYDRWFSELRREQAEPDLNLEPEDRPETEQEDVFEVGEWGIGIRDATSRERDQFDISEGVYIAYVENGSIADDAGVPRDVIITEISGEAVTSTEHALRILEEAAQFEQSILFRVKRRNGITAFYEMEVPVPAG